MTEDAIPRRRFLVGAGAAGTAVAAALAPTLPQQAEAQTPPPPAAVPPANAEPDTLLTLTNTEAAFFTAAVDTLIPADELTPSASECGVTVFIDRQLAGPYLWWRHEHFFERSPRFVFHRALKLHLLAGYQQRRVRNRSFRGNACLQLLANDGAQTDRFNNRQRL